MNTSGSRLSFWGYKSERQNLAQIYSYATFYEIDTGDFYVWINNSWSRIGNNNFLIGNVLGGGTIETGGFILTIPNTGVAALMDYPNAGGFIASGLASFDAIQFDLTPLTLASEGRLLWDVDAGTLELGMPGGNVHLQIGQETIIRVTNKTVADIPNGTAVYINGAQGNRPTITPSIASDYEQSLMTIGLTTELIAKNNTGYITCRGLIHELDTHEWEAGTQLYLSATTPGALTSIAPEPPNIHCHIGVVVVSHASEGIVFVSPHTADRPSEIFVIKTSDYIVSPSDKNIICDTATPMTVTLPAATGNGLSFIIKNINTGLVTVEGNGADTIDGQLNQQLNQWNAMKVLDYITGKWAII